MENTTSQINSPVKIKRQKCDGEYHMPRLHHHNTYEIYYLEHGNRNFIINDKFFEVTDGDFLLTVPLEMHKSSGGSYQSILINFKPEYLTEYYSEKITNNLIKCFHNKIIRPTTEQLKEIKQILEKLLAENLQDPNNMIFLYIGELLLILNRCDCENIEERSNMPNYRLITEITQYINQNYNRINNISQIADKFYITKYHLCRLFKKATDVTVIDYLNNIKIINACCMLTYSKLSITQISFECGFSSTNYFSNTFKNYMRISPSLYRKLNKKI